MENMKHYEPIQEGDRWTIGEWDKDYKAYNVDDGICQYYYWDSLEAAKAAADAYNAYTGLEWLAQHREGNDTMTPSEGEDNPEMFELYSLFGAIEPDEEDEEE